MLSVFLGLIMATVSKIIAKSAARVADGRSLPRLKVEEMASSYDQSTYTALISLEHIKSVLPLPDGYFGDYGKVTALKTTPAPNDEVYLVADIEPHPMLSDMWANGQKRGFSIEYMDNFADTGKTYLTGLAVTSQPASLGTQFSSATDPNLSHYFYYDEQTDRSVCFTSNHQPSAEDNPMDAQQFAAAIQSLNAITETVRTERNEFKQQVADITERFAAEKQGLITEHLAAMTAKETEFTAQLAAKDAEIEALKGQVPAESYTAMPPATGGNSNHKTDC